MADKQLRVKMKARGDKKKAAEAKADKSKSTEVAKDANK